MHYAEKVPVTNYLCKYLPAFIFYYFFSNLRRYSNDQKRTQKTIDTARNLTKSCREFLIFNSLTVIEMGVITKHMNKMSRKNVTHRIIERV